MVPWEILFAVVPGLILFFYGIENFSREILAVAKGSFAAILGRVTERPILAALLGAAVTALVQSSAATTIITVNLVNSGTLSFIQSLGIIIGSNVGTTATAQLVAFKMTAFGQVLIPVGFLVGIFGRRYKFLGKPLFYFGLVFFSLNLISTALTPFQNDPELIGLVTEYSALPLAILIGFLVTATVQSSAITTGLAVILAQQGLLTLPQAIPLLLGANIGSTTTTLIASAREDEDCAERERHGQPEDPGEREIGLPTRQVADQPETEDAVAGADPGDEAEDEDPEDRGVEGCHQKRFDRSRN